MLGVSQTAVLIFRDAPFFSQTIKFRDRVRRTFIRGLPGARAKGVKVSLRSSMNRDRLVCAFAKEDTPYDGWDSQTSRGLGPTSAVACQNCLTCGGGYTPH